MADTAESQESTEGEEESSPGETQPPTEDTPQANLPPAKQERSHSHGQNQNAPRRI